VPTRLPSADIAEPTSTHFVYGDVEITNRQSYAGGIETHDAASIAPIYRRGVLLDVAALQQIASLPADFEITEAVLKRACERQGVEVREGDVVLIRTGWGAFFKDAKRYVNNTVMPGMVLSGAEWLSNRKVFAAGSDTLAFERLPSPAMSVHVHLLVKSGIHLIENLALEELASETPAQFTFAASCLKIQGGTGSPVRPFAIIEV
jgi:kynurenine formamidase